MATNPAPARPATKPRGGTLPEWAAAVTVPFPAGAGAGAGAVAFPGTTVPLGVGAPGVGVAKTISVPVEVCVTAVLNVEVLTSVTTAMLVAGTATRVVLTD